ncbi:MAG TPA: phenylacetaldoxime dehydratase family protein [Steroidobacteraceae bacterium]|nr:phenylacetaldoxime dehydratase family protein [Steroidobacteraceae bacterium]
MTKSRPAGFTPPYDAYEARFRDSTKPLVAAFIGIQDRGGDVEVTVNRLHDLLAGPDGPGSMERGWHVDDPGAYTRLVMAYWRDHEAFERWYAQRACQQWLCDLTCDPLVGRWIEISKLLPRGIDTLIANPKVHWGIAQIADDVEVTPDHAYWGGTRDRIRMSEESDLVCAAGPDLPDAKKISGVGAIVDVQMPAQTVVARGGPDWSKCPADEAVIFKNSVYPAYVAGGRYLRNHPQEAHCYTAYLVQETDETGRDVLRNHLIAYFVQLSDIENWTRNHPTHLEIYGRFMAMVQQLGRMPDMNLYHEVSVIPAGGLTATYVNCLPSTGLLRFGNVRKNEAGR